MRQLRRIVGSPGSSWAGPALRTVALIGGNAGISELATYLPSRWRIIAHEHFQELDTRPDVIVLTAASAAQVREVCARFGDVPVVCTIAPDAPASEAIAVLRAGADACVRSQGPLVLGAHIRACQRRRQARSLTAAERISAVSRTGAFA